MDNILELINLAKTKKNIFIQTHDFPDHDAVVSAYALKQLLKAYDVKSHIIFNGEIQRESLKRMIEELHIEIVNYEECKLGEEDYIIIVDGCKGNKNVRDLTGKEIGVIDHHEVSTPEGVNYVDIRSNMGSCSTIIYSYYESLNIRMERRVATALLIGINMDTALLTRGVNKLDIIAYSNLYLKADINLVNNILRNYIQEKDLKFYKYALENMKIENHVAFCYFSEGCNQNMLGILGDFLLALQEVDFVILCANNDNKINFSLRSERKDWNASIIIQKILEGIGFGGGHSDMAGGIILDVNKFNEEVIYNKFLEQLTDK